MRSAFIITHSVFYLTQVSFVVKAVSALTAAFRLVQLDHCSQSVLASCLRQVHPDLTRFFRVPKNRVKGGVPVLLDLLLTLYFT